ncbi:ras GEF [Laetiporus sulphureus 93-53]|uniref:Ras GEF n=1 Tax=Laetiporus sulphureus 93-53 TaxID=1314785 RepID=A0A165F8R5_9APHY|nr:ras GEF [Laetiporus sulphureus 93-53]KZT08603.1 ras GEF [Laetiporus sulphureus 93-53]
MEAVLLSRTPSLRRGGPLPRLWIDSSLSTYQDFPSSSLPSTRVNDTTSITDPSSGVDTFYVLCLYDFEAQDAGQLSFRKDEVLDVIKVEESGWWAAVRPGESQAGWIPKTFVEPISESVAAKLREVKADPPVHDATAATVSHDQLDFSPEVPLFPTTPDGEKPGHMWVPLLDGDQAPVISLFAESDSKTMLTSIYSPIVPPHEGVDGYHLDMEFTVSPINETIPELERSSLSPIKELHPPLPAMDFQASTKAKPTFQKQRHSSPSQATIADMTLADHTRSYSDPISSANSRHLRRRPVLIEDRSSLRRLSTLFESTSPEELDHILSSPDKPVIINPLSATPLDSSLPRKCSDLERISEGKEEPRQPEQHHAGSHHKLKLWKDNNEVAVHEDSSITAGTFRALLECLSADVLDADVHRRFCRVFFMTIKTFATPDEVFIFLLSRFYMGQPSIANEEELTHWRETVLEPTQRRVLSVIQLWSDGHETIRDDPHIVRRVIDFLSSVPSRYSATARGMILSLQRFIYPARGCHSIKAAIKFKHYKDNSDFIRMHPAAVAAQLSIYVHGLYTKIRPQECLALTIRKISNHPSFLDAFRTVHDKLSAWVKDAILDATTSKKAADALHFWLQVLEECKLLNNFSSMSAVAAGLYDPAISSMQSTWAQVPRDAHLNALEAFKALAADFAAYQRFQDSINEPCVPHVELYLKKISRIHSAYPDNVLSPDGRTSFINFAKREKLHGTVHAMMRYQTCSYPFADDAFAMECIEMRLGRS